MLVLTPDYELAARDQGLAAGLALALEDCDIPAVAPGRYAAVPAGLADGTRPTVTHSLAAREDIVFLDCGPAPRPAPGLDAEPDLAAVGQRLAAVRLGLTRRLLDAAAAHLTERTGGDEPLIRKQLVTGTIADVIAGIELLREYAAAQPAAPGAVLADLHGQISDLDWQVIRLFGAAGYIADHPVRALYVSALVANTWIADGGQP